MARQLLNSTLFGIALAATVSSAAVAQPATDAGSTIAVSPAVLLDNSDSRAQRGEAAMVEFVGCDSNAPAVVSLLTDHRQVRYQLASTRADVDGRVLAAFSVPMTSAIGESSVDVDCPGRRGPVRGTVGLLVALPLGMSGLELDGELALGRITTDGPTDPVRPGARVDLVFRGCAPGPTTALDLRPLSDDRQIAEYEPPTADDTGQVTAAVLLPADLTDGWFRVAVSCTTFDGVPTVASLAVEVDSPWTATTVPAVLPTPPTTPAPATPTTPAPDDLAVTGLDVRTAVVVVLAAAGVATAALLSANLRRGPRSAPAGRPTPSQP